VLIENTVHINNTATELMCVRMQARAHA